MSEDVNVEYLLDVFTTIDANSDSVWDACANFMRHLAWYKKRLTILKPKIEGLPDDHRFKPECSFQLSRLFRSVGDWVERKRLSVHALKLWREWGSDQDVAKTLMELSRTDRRMGFHEDGIQQVKEASEIYQRLGNTMGEVDCLVELARLLNSDEQFEVVEETVLRAIDPLPEQGEQYRVCAAHRLLCNIHQFKGNTEKAVHYYEMVLGIASTSNWHDIL
jgi:tetratricopeptide (TPR) repeat protein